MAKLIWSERAISDMENIYDYIAKDSPMYARLNAVRIFESVERLQYFYKDRWQVELFFKALKQNLKIKTFVGTSANAVKIQIWTALITMLILKYLQLKSRYNWSLSNLVSLLRMNLFTHRNLWA